MVGRRGAGAAASAWPAWEGLAYEPGDHELGSLVDFGAARVIQVAAGGGVGAGNGCGELADLVPTPVGSGHRIVGMVQDCTGNRFVAVPPDRWYG
jgi:hypothetical protein